MGADSSSAGSKISYAYLDEIPSNWKEEANIAGSIDFLSSTISNTLTVDRFKKLTLFRAARCDKLLQIDLVDLPNLIAADFSLSSNLKTININKCPKIRALDVSFCFELLSINGLCKNLEYLSCPNTKLTQIPEMPSLLYFDCSFSENLNIDPRKFPNLELLSVGTYQGTEFSLSQITSFKSLRIFEANHNEIILDSISKGTNVQFLNFTSCLVRGDMELLKNFCCIGCNNIQPLFPADIKPFNYPSAQSLLYGPWGVPDVDQKPPLLSESPTFDPPQNINDNEVRIGIYGAILGSAVMDMIGLGTEFVSSDLAKLYLINPFSITWTHPRVTMHTGSFVRGTSTDDTSQNILIMRSLFQANKSGAENFVEDGVTKFKAGLVKVDLHDFAERLIDWKNNGHSERKHGGGLGMGKTVKSVLSSDNFLDNPIEASKKVWEESGKRVASNGAVMRTAAVGCLAFWDEATVISVAKLMAKVTHYDPRCVFSAVCISLLVARTLQVRAGLKESVDIEKTINDSIANVEGADEFREEILDYSSKDKIQDLDLGNAANMGYTMKTFGAAIWALIHAQSFQDGLIQIVREGGDADTNGAAAGALLGAKFGVYAIPKTFFNQMFDFSWLNREIVSFISLMGRFLSI
ncbi:ADPribosylglycohydrolase superfamily protein [Histomonas meleagridis]|uniref:ADPribosylglycohydrolase superfamily protein n=1 Tax=Histomonas meleagridis TaxID=135588 RepID=UPI003559E930|nr:ADPribosylglycohydrolase superfamily protein [Histomonas meleagridis]KAH0802860.1 ADPribosylglycohydrolase superfamily protein [Histomonas meleagridis]